MKVNRCYLRLVSCFVLGFCLIFSSTLCVNAQEVGSGQAETVDIQNTFTVTLYPNSATVSDFSLSSSGSSTSYSISISEPTLRYVSSATGTNNIYLQSPSSTGSQYGRITFPDFLVNSHTTTGTLTPTNNSSSVTGTIQDIEGVRYFNSDLSFDFLPFVFGLGHFNTTYDFVSVASWSFSTTSSIGALNNIKYSCDGNPATRTNFFSKDMIQRTSSGVDYLVPPMNLSLNFSYAVPSGVGAYLCDPITFTITSIFTLRMSDASSSVVSSSSPTVNDVKGNELQQQNNEVTQDTNTVTHDTNNKVTSFFGAFWDNLLHIFVPESGFFQQWFSDLNSFMSQKLGFLWSPFDFVISFLNGIYSSSGGTSPGIVFPGLTWIDGTVIIPQQTFSFANIGGESFSDLRDMLYFATDVILLGAVVHQFYQKIKIVFEGGSD